MDNTPSQKRKYNEVKGDRKTNYDSLFVIGAQIYSYNGITLPHCMTLTVDNKSHILIFILEAPRITQKSVSHNKLTLTPP